jgi:predicted RNA-binding Zn ribbon-like protein
MSDDTAPVRWKLIAGAPCLDFINTVGGRVPDPGSKCAGGVRVMRESLESYDDLLRWADFASLVTGPELGRLRELAAEDPRRAAAVHARAVAFREALYRLGAAVAHGRQPTPCDVSWLDQEWHAARDAQRISIRGGTQAGRITAAWQEEPRLERLLWPLALDAVDLFSGGNHGVRLDRLKQCPGESCGWLFLDTSRNGSRQWCDMRDCGNLAKVRRFRQRLRDETLPEQVS